MGKKGFKRTNPDKKVRKKTNDLNEELNKAINFHTNGDIAKAEKIYEDLIKEKKLNHPVLLNNYAVICRKKGKTEETIKLLQKCNELFPDYADAYSNLGNTLRQQGKELTLAEAYLKKSIELKPSLFESHLNLAFLYQHRGYHEKSLDQFIELFKIQPDNKKATYFILSIIKIIDIDKIQTDKLKTILKIVLSKDNVSHSNLWPVFEKYYSNIGLADINQQKCKIIENSLISNIIKDDIFIRGLKKILLVSIEWEIILTKARKEICELVYEKNYNETQHLIELCSAIGEQCFLNEYLFNFEENEIDMINSIIKDCNERGIKDIQIAILSCYLPLHNLAERIESLNMYKTDNESINDLITFQKTEPIEEKTIRLNITKIAEIKDNASKKVKDQYEVNPYPRWRSIESHYQNKVSISNAIRTDIRPNDLEIPNKQHRQEVLIAGCGTGRQIIHATRYQNSNITAIDLSITSLSYAQRKLNEKNLNQVKLIAMDILEIPLLNKKFDVIECCGVLHHMNEPAKGLRILSESLVNNGYIKLALYSRTARKIVKELREYINAKNLNNSVEDIRKFRNEIKYGELRQFKSIAKWQDFFSISMCRDLCFHVVEHNYNLKEIKNMLTNANLDFIGFIIEEKVKEIYKQSFPQDKKQINLENWQNFEEIHQNVFRGMYQFWVKKS